MNISAEQYPQFQAPTVSLTTQFLQGRWATAALVVLCSNSVFPSDLCSHFGKSRFPSVPSQHGGPASCSHGSHIGHLLLLDSDSFPPSPQQSEEVRPPVSPDRHFQPWEGTGHFFTLPFEISTNILCIHRAESGSATSVLLWSVRKESRIPPEC